MLSQNPVGVSFGVVFILVGCGGVVSEEGGDQSDAQSDITGSITIGETSVLATNDSNNANLLLVQQATLDRAATIQSLSFYVTTTSGDLRLGIYDASGSGGGPGALISQTASFRPTTGWNKINVLTPVSLPRGTYWLGYLPSSDGLGFRKQLTGSAKYVSYAFGSLPSTFPTAAVSSATVHWSAYATLSADGSGGSGGGGGGGSGGTRVAKEWPFSSDSPWNTPLSANAQYVNSSTLNNVAPIAQGSSWSTPVVFAKLSDPLIWITRRDYYNVNVPMNVRMPASADGSPPDLCPTCAYSDAMLEVVDQGGRHLHEFFRYDKDDHQTGGHFTSCPASICPGVNQVHADLDLVSGNGWSYNEGPWKSASASGASWMGGLIRKWELDAVDVGSIRHVLAAAMPWGMFFNCTCSSACSSSQVACYQWPAISSDGGGPTSYSGTDTNLRMGTLIALDWNLDINALGLSAAGTKVAWALQHFGAYIRDQGGRFKFFMEQDAASYESVLTTDLAKLKGHFRIITNNAPGTPGGGASGSARRAPLAPTPVAVPTP